MQSAGWLNVSNGGGYETTKASLEEKAAKKEMEECLEPQEVDAVM